jgi:hypothetical protein
MSALQFGNRARKIKVNASKNVHKNWKLECGKLQAQLDNMSEKNQLMTKKIITLKRIMRDCGIDEDDFNSGEDEEEGDGVGSLHSSKKKKNNSENRRRQSLHAAKSNKQALELQMKEMKQALEAKIAEAASTNQSKDDELEMYKLQIRELKKNSSNLSSIVENLHNTIYQLELTKTDLVLKNERGNDKIESLEYLVEDIRKKNLVKYINMETLFQTTNNQLIASNNDLRELELELRKSGSDNEYVKENISRLFFFLYFFFLK